MMRLQLIGLTLVAALLAAGNAHAAGDKARGRQLVYTCNGCHGVEGYSNVYPSYPVPRIAGQNEQYIINALHEYKSGDRTHSTMMAQAQSLSEQDIEDVAAYLSSLAPDFTADQQKAVDQRIGTLANSTGAQKAAACFACHGKDGEAIDPQYPRLAGQYTLYLQQALHEYQDGRRNNPIMKGFAATLSDDDIQAVTTYFSSLPGKLSTLHGHIQGDSAP